MNFEITKPQMIAQGIPLRILHRDSLYGLAEIACYLGYSISTVRRLSVTHNLPILRCITHKYTSSKSALNLWKSAVELAEQRADLGSHNE